MRKMKKNQQQIQKAQLFLEIKIIIMVPREAFLEHFQAYNALYPCLTTIASYKKNLRSEHVL